MTTTCKSCRFFKPGKLVAGNGACRRYPPTNMIVPNGRGANLQSMYAAITPDDWCGEYQPPTANWAPCAVLAQPEPGPQTFTFKDDVK